MCGIDHPRGSTRGDRPGVRARVRGLDAVESSILSTRRGAGCALRSRQARIEPEPPIVGGPLKPLAPVRRKPNEDAGIPPLRVASGVDKPVPGAPTVVTPLAAAARQAAAGSTNPFAFSTITNVGSPPTANRIAEPSQASAGRVVWYTGNDDGNDGAAYSLDSGATFTHVNPRLMFPEGVNAFCCDQVVRYVPQINRFIWLIQYWCPKPDQRCERARSSNQDRLLVASPQDIVKDPTGAWRSYVIRSKDVGHPREWLDFPALGVGRHSLYITSNIFGGNGGGFRGSVVARVNLTQLKAGRGSHFITTTTPSATPTSRSREWIRVKPSRRRTPAPSS